jgi:formylglycine-generating enzyme required for sulfatase activity
LTKQINNEHSKDLIFFTKTIRLIGGNMKKCKKCGHIIKSDDFFCVYDGSIQFDAIIKRFLPVLLGIISVVTLIVTVLGNGPEDPESPTSFPTNEFQISTPDLPISLEVSDQNNQETIILQKPNYSKQKEIGVPYDKILIPAGDFIMGATNQDRQIEASSNELPKHKVYLDNYFIDRTEVTNEMFIAFVEATNYITVAEKTNYGHIYSDSINNTWYTDPSANWRDPEGLGQGIKGRENYPVVQMNWEDAKNFCKWRGGRLPTEAEWEKAARGTNENIYPWGNTYDGALLNGSDKTLGKDSNLFIFNDGYAFTAPVGSFPEGASPYGVLDMAGNILEWVNDFYDENYYAQSPERNPTGPSNGQNHLLRGGSWFSGPKNNRSANRTPAENLDVASINYGFRCAYDQ